MNLFKQYHGIISSAVLGFCEADQHQIVKDALSRMTVEPPRDPAHGDLATNAAMLLSKPLKQKPRDVAEKIAAALADQDDIEQIDISGPGFINLRLKPASWQALIPAILDQGTAYGQSDLGGGEKVNIEYVSANPTGPMHVGHGRGAVVGDVLASLLAKAGYDVTREYYINDAGVQIRKLGYSVYVRYLEALGRTMDEAAIAAILPEGESLEYQGDYLVPVGQALATEYGEKLADMAVEQWQPIICQAAIDQMMALIREDLQALGIHHDVFSSEAALVKGQKVDQVMETLKSRDLIYHGVLEAPKGKQPEDWEPRPQNLFKSTDFGDDVDRPIQKSDGSWTYFASDIAYHLDKYQRGFKKQIDMFGADHGGYVKRMKAAVTAISDGEASLDVLLCQLVKLMRDGEPVKMSKRAGTFVTLREVVDEVGKDVFRFYVLTRKADAQLEFDLVKVLETTKDNPVFYVQYAHARIHSVLRNLADVFPDMGLSPEKLAKCDLSLLSNTAEMTLIRHLGQWPRIVEAAAQAREPHRIAFYLYDLASSFHSLWTQGKDATHLRFIVADDVSLTNARMALLQATASVIASGLDVIGVKPIEEMH